MLHLRGKGRAESEALFHELVKEDVLVVPGYAFDATGGAADPVRTQEPPPQQLSCSVMGCNLLER